MKYFEEQEGYLVANFEFEGFVEALKFLNECAQIFESRNHHGDIEIYDYRYVGLRLTTHDTDNQITDKDHGLAEAVEALYDQ